MKTIRLAAILGILLLVAGCAGMHAAGMGEKRTDVLYTCDCGADCKCNSMSTEPGNCTCGKPMKWGHVLRIEGTKAVLCQCAEGCRCEGLDPKDASKCLCGSPVKEVNLAGSGLYYCNCGGSCACGTVSKTPGKCRCGMDLKQAN